MKQRRAGRKHLFAVGVVFAIVAFLVGLAHFQARYGITREPPEMTVKRFDRDKNGWFELEEALRLLPPKPEAAWVPIEPGSDSMGNYQPGEDSLGTLLGICRPDDDPLLLEYIAAAPRVIEKVHLALRKPWIMLPVEWRDKSSPYHPSEQLYAFHPVHEIVGLMMVHAELMSRESGRADEAADVVRDAVRLQDRLIEAVPMTYLGSSLRWHFACRVLVQCSRATQNEMLHWALELKRPVRPSDEAVLLMLRMQDVYYRNLDMVEELKEAPWDASEILLRKYRLARHHRLAFDAARMTPDEINAMARASHVIVWQFNWRTLSSAVAGWNVGMARVILCLGRELYKHDHGQYPADPSALVPDYLPSLDILTEAEREA